jgi:hypothetical protein
MWIVDILPLHDTIARLPLHEEGTRFIIVFHRTKRDYYTDVDVIILFVSSWQQVHQQLFPSVSLASLPLVFLLRWQDPGKKLS